MIYEALTEIAEQVNQHFKLRFGITEDKLFISNVVNNDGSDAIEKDSVILSLINLQEEKKLLNKANPNDNPPISLRMLLLFSTTFSGKRQTEALKFIQEIIGFFQQDKVIETADSRLIFEFFNVDLGLQNNLWASLGAKYSTSVVYSVGLIHIDESMDSEEYVPSQAFPEDEGRAFE